MSGNQAFKDHSYGPSEYGVAVTTGAKTGAGGLKFKTILRIYWRSSFEYLTTKELAEPEAASRVMTSAAAGVGACVAVRAGMQWSLPLVGVSPASSFLPL